MENEELFVGETALDTEQQALNGGRTTGDISQPPLRVRSEDLLTGVDSDEELPQPAEGPLYTDKRPRWRKPSVSLALGILRHKSSDDF